MASALALAATLSAYVATTSMMFFGRAHVVYLALENYGDAVYVISAFSALAGGAVLFMVLDGPFWSNRWAKRAVYSALMVLCLVSGLSLTATFSIAPMVIMLAAVSLAPLLTLKMLGSGANAHAQIFPRLFGFASIAVAVAWVLWVFSHMDDSEGCGAARTWSVHLREASFASMQCDFQVTLSFHSGDNAIELVPCSFRSGCKYRDAQLGIENFDAFTAVEPTSGLCALRGTRMLRILAELVAAEAGGQLAEVVTHTESETSVVVHLAGVPFVSATVDYSGCLRGFMQWISPLIAAIACAWLSMAFSFVHSDTIRASVLSPCSLTDSQVERDAVRWRWLSRVLVLALVCLWTSASIGGAEMKLANTTLLLTCVAIMLVIAIFVLVYGMDDTQKIVLETDLARKVQRYAGTDWAKALLILCTMPLLAIFVIISVLNQAARRSSLLLCTRAVDEGHQRKWLTASAEKRLRTLRSWNWTSVLRKVSLLGMLYLTLSVLVGKFTSVLLSVLNEWLREMGFSLGTVTAIFFAIGFCIFLNPVIPGVPVYLSGGVVLVESAWPTLGFWGGMLFTTMICLVLKFTAIAVQQKVVGEKLGKSVRVRHFIMVNSVGCRAIKLILEEPGLRFNKIAVLCGGPDWPISVTTGILRLRLVQMLVGSLPIVFLIAPCVVSGGLLLRANEDGVWETMSVLALAIAFAVQSLAMVAALNAIATVAKDNEEMLRAMPDDQDVLALTLKEAAHEALRKQVMDWSNKDTPTSIRVILASGAVAATGSFMLAMTGGSLVFESFSVSDSIEEKLGGNALSLIVFPLGYVCVAGTVWCGVANAITEIYFARAIRRASRAIAPNLPSGGPLAKGS